MEWVSDWCFKSQLTILQSYRDWNKVYQAQWLGLWTRSCLYVVCMYWTRLVLVRPAASLYSASPLKHHATGRQWCPNPDHYPDSEPASRSLTLLCWALSRAAEPQILTSFVWRGRGSNHQPPACQGNSQPLHYPAAVHLMEGKTLMTVGLKIFNTFNTCYINMADNLGNDESFDQASSLDTIFDHFKE